MSGALPSFPLNAFPPELALFCESVAEHTQTPPEMAACAMLGALSAVSLGIKVDAGGWEEELALYLLVVMGAANRKSSVMTAITAPLEQLDSDRREAERDQVDAARTRRELSERRRQALLAKSAKTDDRQDRDAIAGEIGELDRELRELGEPHAFRRLAADATAEALAGLLSKHGRIAVLSAEGAFLDNLVGGRYSDGSANLHLTCQAYSGESTIIDRRARDVEMIDRPLLTIVLAVQDHHLPQLVQHPVARSQGLVSRFAFVVPRSRVGHRKIETDPIPDSLLEHWGETLAHVEALIPGTPATTDTTDTTSRNLGSVGSVINSLLSRNELNLSLSLSPKAKTAFDRLRGELEPKLAPGRELGHVADWASRHPGRLARIAGLLHLAGREALGTPISGDTMDRAILIADFLMAHGRAALDGPDAKQRRAQQVLDQWEQETITQRDLQRAVFHGRGAAGEVAELLTALVDDEQLERIPVLVGPKGGRPPSPTYRIVGWKEAVLAAAVSHHDGYVAEVFGEPGLTSSRSLQ